MLRIRRDVIVVSRRLEGRNEYYRGQQDNSSQIYGIHKCKNIDLLERRARQWD